MEDLEPEPPAAASGDQPVEETVPDSSDEPEGRRYPSTIGGAFYLVVLAAAAFGLGVVGHGNWRLGVKWIAASLVFAALVRLVLPARDAGMLAVRRRLVDVLLLAAVGVILWFLAGSIPNQPPA